MRTAKAWGTRHAHTKSFPMLKPGFGYSFMYVRATAKPCGNGRDGRNTILCSHDVRLDGG